MLALPIKTSLDFRVHLETLVCSRVLLLPITIRETNLTVEDAKEAIRAINPAEGCTTAPTITIRPTEQITTVATSTAGTSTALPKPTIAMPSKALWAVALARTEPKDKLHRLADTAKANTATKASSREGTTRKEVDTITIAAGAEEATTAITIATEVLLTISRITVEVIKATWVDILAAWRRWEA